MRRVLITGGAGFIGSHLAGALLRRGDSVRILDCLLPQVHGANIPGIVTNGDVEFLPGDVCDPALAEKAVRGVDCVVHLAAEVGVGQSMYEPERYVRANDVGAATVFAAAARAGTSRVVVASSMSVYGEGAYRDVEGRLIDVDQRPLRTGSGWDPTDDDGRPLVPAPTPETKRPALASVYALSKYSQERLALVLARAHGMEGVALRLFNVYGAGQALSNPYTGVLANFAIRILKGRPPLVFEDGRQMRDFVHVDDAVDALVLALDSPKAAGETLNIASGTAISVADAAMALAGAMGRPDLEPEIIGKARAGDVRHCIADIARAADVLGYRPRRRLDTALPALADWVAQQDAVDRVGLARRELESRGLVA